MIFHGYVSLPEGKGLVGILCVDFFSRKIYGPLCFTKMVGTKKGMKDFQAESLSTHTKFDIEAEKKDEKG